MSPRSLKPQFKHFYTIVEDGDNIRLIDADQVETSLEELVRKLKKEK